MKCVGDYLKVAKKGVDYLYFLFDRQNMNIHQYIKNIDGMHTYIHLCIHVYTRVNIILTCPEPRFSPTNIINEYIVNTTLLCECI